MSNYSKACCTNAVTVASGEAPSGSYGTVGGIKCYVTGPRDAKSGILINYDIFGFTNSLTLKAADVFGDAGYLTIVPDLLKGEHPDVKWLIEGTPESFAKFEAFAKEKIDFPGTAKKIPQLLESFQAEFPTVKGWGAVGYCWGGKVVALASQQGTPLLATVQSSPAAVAGEDAGKIVIPHLMLASKEEPAADVKAFASSLKVAGGVETFENQLHGWMSSRADFTTDQGRADYERGYEVAIEFLNEHVKV